MQGLHLTDCTPKRDRSAQGDNVLWESDPISGSPDEERLPHMLYQHSSSRTLRAFQLANNQLHYNKQFLSANHFKISLALKTRMMAGIP